MAYEHHCPKCNNTWREYNFQPNRCPKCGNEFTEIIFTDNQVNNFAEIAQK